MKYTAKKGLMDTLRGKLNKKRVIFLLIAGLAVGGFAKDVYDDYSDKKQLEEELYKHSPEYFLENPDERIKERQQQVDELYPDVEEEAPEYVNEYGVEITKEEWLELQRQKEKQNIQNKQKGEDLER